jgi:DNA-binding NarL/FixJ family response regulator
MSEEKAPRTLLLIENSVVIRRCLAEMLQEANFSVKVVEADNARDAVHLFREQPPDLVMIALPSKAKEALGAIEFVHRSNCNIPVIVLASESSQEIRERCLRAGAHHVFRKSREFDLAIAAAIRLLKQ